MGLKKPSSRIVLAFQGDRHSLNSIKVEINASLSQEDPLEKEMATHSIEVPGGLHFMELQSQT